MTRWKIQYFQPYHDSWINDHFALSLPCSVIIFDDVSEKNSKNVSCSPKHAFSLNTNHFRTKTILFSDSERRKAVV